MTDNRFSTGGAFDALPSDEESLASRLVGRVLSGYQIEGLAGKGGMGYVFRASRAERDFERLAAIKIVPSTLASSELASRFRTEVKILAKLNHASIAQLYDAGETEEGWPYIVMEFVDGQPIDEYCKSQNLGVNDRLTLLADVARAVRFAHARLIVHRDLKPSNVLVAADGKPKLLDFGIAKLLEPGTDQHTVAHRPMTPKYASPEQLLGSDITIGSDIYQLGILFLTVLGQELPFENTSLQDAIRRAAANQDADISEKTRKDLSPDLIAVITHCLHSDPDDRYSDVNALLRDIESYLHGFPVSARKGTAMYRLRKLVHRNIPATIFAVLALAIALGGSAYYAINITAARNVAENRARTSSQVLQAMSRMIAETYSELIETRSARSSPAAEEDLQNEPLRLALERTNRLIESVETDDPSIRGELLLVQGLTNRELNRFDISKRQLDEALELMVSTNNTEGRVNVLNELLKLASSESSNIMTRKYLDAALEIIDTSPVSDKTQADLYVTATEIETDLGNPNEALMYAQKAIAILEAMPGKPPTSLARAYTKAGLIYGRLEQREELREWTQKGVDLFIELEGPNYRGLASAYSGLAFSYALEGDYEPALKYFQLEHDISRANFGEQHLRSAIGLVNMGIALRRMNRLEEAADSLLRAEVIMINVAGDDSRRLSGLYTNLGNVYQDMGDLDRAAETFERGLALFDPAESNPRDYAYLLNNTGDLLSVMGHTNEGQQRLREALDEKTRIFGANNISTARTLLLLVNTQIQTGVFTDAEDLLRNAESIYAATYTSDHTKMSFLELIKGKYAREKGDLIRAQQLITSAYTRRLEEYDETHPDLLLVALEMARTEFALGDFGEARRWLDIAVAGYTESADSSLEIIEIDLINAELLAAEGDIDTAMQIERDLTQTIATHFPARTDWQSRLKALQLNQ